MSRSRRKGPYVCVRLLEKLKKAKQGDAIQTTNRSSCITPRMVGYTFLVHNGRKFVPVYVTVEMVGHKLGAFVETRTFKMHAGDRKTK